MPKKDKDDNITPGDNSLAQLPAYVERIERLEDEKKAIGDDIKDVYLEAKDHGLVPKVLRTFIKRRKVDRVEQAELERMLELYTEAFDNAPKK